MRKLREVLPDRFNEGASASSESLQDDHQAPESPGWVAERVPRRNFLMRTGTAIAGFVASASVLKAAFPEMARAACHAGCFCPGVCVSCYRRYVCACQDVYLRYCPGGSLKNTLPHASTFDIQRPPSSAGGYEYGYGYAVSDGRGWVYGGCLTTYSC